MEGLLYHVIIIISLVPHLSFCQDEDVFHCSAKPGCQISQCDTIAPAWNQPGFSVSQKVDRNEFPITCKSKNSRSSNNNGFLLNFMQGNAQDIRNMMSEMKELEEQVEQNTKLTEEMEELKKRNENLENELSTLRKSDRATKRELKQLRDKFSAIQKTAETSKQALKEPISINEDLKNEILEIRKTAGTNKKELEKIKKELSLLRRPGKINNRECFSTCKAARSAVISNEVTKLCLPVIGSTDVRCDFETDGGDWLIILRRSDGSINFDRNWSDYVNGFGILGSEFWFGLEKLHVITSNKKYEIRIDMKNFDGEKRFAKYSKFVVGPYSEKYKLTIGGYSGDARDAFFYHNQRPFSTKNNDNDGLVDKNCGEIYKGGWWFRDCFHCHLTGPYVKDEFVAWRVPAIKWTTWGKSIDEYYSLQFVEMKIRPVG